MARRHRLWNVIRRSRLDRDIERELSFHLAERAEELRGAGCSEAEAIQRAARQFGNLSLQRERTRDMDIAIWFEGALRNLRHAVRALAKAPAFTATVVVTLALGIGANSAVFSALYAVLLRPLPYPEADRLMVLRQVSLKTPVTLVAPVRLEDWNRMNGTFQAITGYYTEDITELSGELPEKLKRALVAPRFLQVWGVSPALGRGFSSSEEKLGGPEAVLISSRLWHRRFGGDEGAVGKKLRLGRASYSVVGIMPASFRFPDRDVDLWSPSPADAPYAQSRQSTWFVALGRLKPGITRSQAQADLSTVQANLRRAYPKTDADVTVRIQPLKETTVDGVRDSLWLLYGSVSLLLLIACTNIAALFLSRDAQRRPEVSIRLAIGGSRASVTAQILTESFLLALLGAGFGLLIADLASSVFRILAAGFPRVEEIGLDWRILIYALTTAVGATLACGIFPAVKSTRRGASGSLAQAGRACVSARHPLQWLLVGVQVALAVTLLAGAGLLLRSLQALGRVEPGFEPGHVLTFQISTTWGETADTKRSSQRTERILGSLRDLPGVEAAATSILLPGAPARYPTELKVAEGRAETEPKIIAENRFVSHGYFATMHVPLLAGSFCREEQNNTCVVVNRSFAETYFRGAAALGHHLSEAEMPHPGEIRGIVGDAREQGISQPPVPTVYWCVTGIQPGTYFLVRTRGEVAGMSEVLRRKIHEVEPMRSVFDVKPLAEHLDDSLAENRLRTFLLASFALTALLLACVGLYGALSYLVSIRRREVGLRLALGALRGRILKSFLFQGLGITSLGCIAGLGLAAASGRMLAGMLYGVGPSDAVTAAAVVFVMLTVAGIASLLPAIRAARVDPVQVLRDE